MRVAFVLCAWRVRRRPRSPVAHVVTLTPNVAAMRAVGIHCSVATLADPVNAVIQTFHKRLFASHQRSAARTVPRYFVVRKKIVAAEHALQLVKKRDTAARPAVQSMKTPKAMKPAVLKAKTFVASSVAHGQHPTVQTMSVALTTWKDANGGQGSPLLVKQYTRGAVSKIKIVARELRTDVVMASATLTRSGLSFAVLQATKSAERCAAHQVKFATMACAVNRGKRGVALHVAKATRSAAEVIPVVNSSSALPGATVERVDNQIPVACAGTRMPTRFGDA